MFFYSQKQAFLLWAVLFVGVLAILAMPAFASAESLYQTSSFRASVTTEFNSGLLDASLYSSLSLSFYFDATTLDFGPPQDTFSYGYRQGGNEYILGTFLGLAGSTTAETGVVEIDLPESAEVADLQVFISVVANSTASSDKVELRNIALVGLPRPVIVDVCSNISGNQETVPSGYQADAGNICIPIVIEPEPIDVCTNLPGAQAAVPVGYEIDLAGDCVLIPLVIVDVCSNIAGTQAVIPEGYVINTDGDCVLVVIEPIDVCLNLGGIQETIPQGYEKNQAGDCVLIPLTPIDICSNLSGLQESLPGGYEKDLIGDCVVITVPEVDICLNLPGLQTEVPANFLLNADGDCVLIPVSPVDLCPNLDGIQATIPSGQMLNSAGQCVAIVVTPPPVPPTPSPKLCPRGFTKWIDRFTAKHIWRADDVYEAVILVGGPISRHLNRDKGHFLYIAGPTEVGDKYYRRFHKIIQVCVKG